MKKTFFILALTVSGLFVLQGCGATSVAASILGVGAECTSNDNCDTAIALTCITDFKGGYCGKANCTENAECPAGSICVTDSGTNYCFLVCTDKTECNLHRTTDEANCSADITKVEAGDDKVCIPPPGAGA